jgi:hypothetical protein
MPRLTFRDRFYSPPVARSLTAPSSILATGVGAAAGILVFGPLGVLAGLAAYGARVALAIPRAGKGERIDPFAVNEPWRQFVQHALASRTRFAEAVQTMKPGPLRDHLGEIGERLDEGVEECWRIARRGQLLARARSQVDDASTRRELDQLLAEAGGTPPEGSTQAKVLEALQAQLATAKRMDTVLDDTRSRLQLLDARRDESVTRAIELSVQSGPDDLTGLGDDVDGIVTEMEALRQALEDEGHRDDFPNLDSSALGPGSTSAQTSAQSSPPTADPAGTSNPTTFPPGGPNDIR